MSTPEVVDVRRRLAALVSMLGEPAMHLLADAIVDAGSRTPPYREGMFSSPPGMTATAGDVLAPPLPAVE